MRAPLAELLVRAGCSALLGFDDFTGDRPDGGGADAPRARRDAPVEDAPIALADAPAAVDAARPDAARVDDAAPPCDLASPSCPGGEACDVDRAGCGTSCRTAGGTGSGASCRAPTDCAAGLTCRAGACLPLCDGTCPSGQRCAPICAGSPDGVCTWACALTGTNDCPTPSCEGQICTSDQECGDPACGPCDPPICMGAFATPAQDGCVAQVLVDQAAGAAAAASTCAAAIDETIATGGDCSTQPFACGDGRACYSADGATYTCVELCLTQTDCAAGACTPFPVATTINGTTYSYCK